MLVIDGLTRRLGCSGSALLALVALSLVAHGSSGTEGATTLSETDAQILIYVSPVGESARAGGSDIAMEQQTSAKLNQAAYYYFWVYDAKRGSSGSVTIGYYAVNKHTGDVWDTVENKRLSSALLLGVQKILLRSHHIGEGTIRRYHGVPF